jgi:hypothetical protein
MGLSSSDCKESESQQRDTPFDLSAIQAAVDQAVLLSATATHTALMQAAADREIAENAVREMDTARRKAADQALTYNAQVCREPLYFLLLPFPSPFLLTFTCSIIHTSYSTLSPSSSSPLS